MERRKKKEKQQLSPIWRIVRAHADTKKILLSVETEEKRFLPESDFFYLYNPKTNSTFYLRLLSFQNQQRQIDHLTIDICTNIHTDI